MRNLKQKFIITDSGFRMGRSVFHKDLNRNDSKVIGGGSWYWDQENDTLYLYGASYDFGSVSKEDIESNMKGIKKRYFRNSNVIFEENENRTLLDILTDKMEEGRARQLIAGNDFI